MENENGEAWREELFQKMRSMKEMYLPGVNDFYQRVVVKLQHEESLPHQQRSDKSEKLEKLKTVLERTIELLTVSKSDIMPDLKDRVDHYEKQLIRLLNTYRPIAARQQGQVPQSRTIHDQSVDDNQTQSMSLQVSAPRTQQSVVINLQNNVVLSVSGVSALQHNMDSSIPASSLASGQGNVLNNANGGDWQEELFQRIKAVKDMYLPELTKIHQGVVLKLQQREQDSIPQQQRPDLFEKYEQFKTVLERIMQFLSVSKSNIKPASKVKVAYYEKHVKIFLDLIRPRKSVQQGQQLPQSQTIHDQPHHVNQQNLQIQSISLQVSAPRTQQSIVINSQNDVLSSLPGVSVMQQNTSSSIPASSLASGQGNVLNKANGGDWREEVFQKIKSMKDMYLPDLIEFHQRVAVKLQQRDSIGQQQIRDQFETLEKFKKICERIIEFLYVPKSDIMPSLKDNMDYYEKQIIGFLNTDCARVILPQRKLPAISDEFRTILMKK